MVAQITMPYPLGKMFEHLDLDVERSFELLPAMMEDAMVSCRMCSMFRTCDFDVESRYFMCPNRDLLDKLERLLDKI